jgi:uncharacterized protein (TIGR04255 family)
VGCVMDRSPLPKYNKPPVIETVLGVQFAPLKSFSMPHFGLFWSEIRATYPRQEMKEPIANVVEDVVGTPAPDKISIRLTSEPEARCWFLNASGTELIQLQNDHFVRNWRKVTGSEEYPSYDLLRPRFERDWDHLISFLDREGIGQPEVNQCEVTYINHLAVEVDELGSAHRFAHGLSSLAGQFLPPPETTQLVVRYLMADKKGRLHVVVRPGIRLDDRHPVLQLTLTARGAPASSRRADILAWFDVGHEWVVRGFSDFTRPEMHAIWERTQ